MSNKKGLGKGLEALIPSDFDTALIMDAGDRVQNVYITHIQPNPEQPRRHFDEVALKELSVSIQQYGVIQPIILSPQGDTYIIVAGERRWRAAQQAGLEQIPAIVRDREELEQLEVALIENVQRVDLSALEQAISIERLHQQFNIPYTEIAQRLGKAEATISNTVRLLQLPPIAREALQAGVISEGHARAILSLKESPEQQIELLELIQKNGWSVRQAEQYATSLKAGAKSANAAKRATTTETKDTKKIGTLLNTKVTLKHTARGGRVEIHFKNDEQLKQLLDKLEGISE